MKVSRITVANLMKTYRVPEREPGLKAALGSLFRRTARDVEAVRGITFSVEAGEMVGFIGPNGAGKTTTLKMLCGLLYPTGGEAHVLGYVPWERKPAYLRRISMVLGNKSQMLWDIPPLDSFRVLSEIYRVPPAQYQQTLDELVALLEMEDLLTKPVRNFSLGERMKCELVAGLLHRPEVLFLDEPTLGLDVSMQGRLRRFLAEYNRHSGVTVLLTSHYMADVTALCPRVILIHHGQLLYDGMLQGLAQQLAPFKLIRMALRHTDTELQLPVGVEIIERENGALSLRVPRAEAPALTAQLLQALPVADLAVEDPPIEAVIDQIYQEGEVGVE
ncbi:MAG: ATP-binding cassette domain-containing protein [Anaerolineae bacterium]|jgi:ABC-2 type transport system ATP-binding protein|nr:ATP-binding cassette domain-containing protein [Anaerolineae bacterium]